MVPEQLECADPALGTGPGIGSPYGLHGFIPGILVSLVAMVIVSLITERLPDDHLERVWGER